MGEVNHISVNDILLGPLERPALRWLAAHSLPGCRRHHDHHWRHRRCYNHA
jgi:hypothetical protein